jgi:hypothetical protein
MLGERFFLTLMYIDNEGMSEEVHSVVAIKSGNKYAYTGSSKQQRTSGHQM